MKRIMLIALAALLAGSFTAQAKFEMPSEEEIAEACIDTKKLGPLLLDANAEQIIAVTTKVLDCIQNSLFPETIKERLVTAVATAIAIAESDAPTVAVGLTQFVQEQWKPYVVATSVLVSGEWSDEVKAALLGAIPNREMVTQAAENPIRLVLGQELARAAIEAALFAVGSVETASEQYFSLKRRPKGGLPGEEFIPRGEFYFGQMIYDPFTGRFIRTVGVFTDSTQMRLIPQSVRDKQHSDETIRQSQTLPFDRGFVDDRTGRFAGRFIDGKFVPDTEANAGDDLFLRTPGNRPTDRRLGRSDL